MTKKAPDTAANSFPKLAAPAQRALAGAGYTHLDQLAKVTEAELSQLHGMGPNALKTLRQALTDKGLSFAIEEKGSSVHEQTPFPSSIGRPATNALTHMGFTTLEQLTKISEAELKNLHGVGPKAVGLLREALAAKGLSFAGKSK